MSRALVVHACNPSHWECRQGFPTLGQCFLCRGAGRSHQLRVPAKVQGGDGATLQGCGGEQSLEVQMKLVTGVLSI
jgi:hypothetical protein